MEVELAARGGLGWRGKHTLLLSRDAGSLFFLGEIFVSLDLAQRRARRPSTAAPASAASRCARRRRSSAPYQLDARRCISYLTIEHKGAIPEELRPLMGNRIYGCDDCQLVCPWNKYAQRARRSGLRGAQRPRSRDAGRALRLDRGGIRRAASRARAIRRIGYERWLRNIAVALGNAPTTPAVVAALRLRAEHPSALVREHVAWALVA